MKILSIAIFCSFLFFSCQSNLPDEKFLKEKYEEAVPFLELKDVKKIDGVEFEERGIKGYAMTWDAKVYAKKDISAYYEGLRDSVLKPDDDKEWEDYYKNSKAFGLMRKGGSYKAGSFVTEIKNKNTKFAKTENGWQY